MLPDGTTERFFWTVEAEDRLVELKSEMYRPGGGTWFGVVVSVAPGGTLAVDLNYDEPTGHDFAIASWRQELETYPRSPDAVPQWLTERVTLTPSTWLGARFAVSFTATGHLPPGPLDGTGHPHGQQWAGQLVDLLAARSIRAQAGSDEGEDLTGNQVTYPEVLVDLGDGCCTVDFWVQQITMYVDVAEDQADRPTTERVLRAVTAAIAGRTGWTAEQAGLEEYDRSLLDPGSA